MKHTNPDRLERWLGADVVRGLSADMRDFYAPVAVAGVPGNVMAMPGGVAAIEIPMGAQYLLWKLRVQDYRLSH